MNQEYREIQNEIIELIEILKGKGFRQRDISKNIEITQSLLSMSKNRDFIRIEVLKDIRDKLNYLIDIDLKPEKSGIEVLKEISKPILIEPIPIEDWKLQFEEEREELILNFRSIVNPNSLANFLKSIDNTYNKLYIFDKFIANKNLVLQNYFDIFSIDSKPASENRLEISEVKFSSPGFWKFIGDLNIITQIREFIKEYHERKKDKDYRNESESERLKLENRKLTVDVKLQEEKLSQIKEINELELIKTKIEILEKSGYSKDEIKKLISSYYINPLMGLSEQLKLNQYDDSKDKK